MSKSSKPHKILTKKIYDATIYLEETNGLNTYATDISPMFEWMEEFQWSPDPVILDVGANIGLFSLAYASIFKNAQIHSFEPVGFIFDFFVENLSFNPHLSSNIHPHNFGLSDREENQSLSIPTSNQHIRYKNDDDIRLFSILGESKTRFEANLTTIDQWVDNFRISKVDFIKIDVEGYEYRVLQGASKTLSALRPVVMFELNQLTLSLCERTEEEYIKFCEAHDYEVFGLQYGFKRELLRIDDLDKIKLVSDLIIVPRT